MEQHQDEDGDGEHGHPVYRQREPEAHDRPRRVRGADGLVVASEQEVRDVAKHEPDAEEQEERLHRPRGAARQVLHQATIDDDPEEERGEHDDGNRQVWVDAEAFVEHPSHVGAGHDDAAMVQVDHAQYAVDEAEAVRHRGIEAREEDGRDDEVGEPLHRAPIWRSSDSAPCPCRSPNRRAR